MCTPAQMRDLRGLVDGNRWDGAALRCEMPIGGFSWRRKSLACATAARRAPDTAQDHVPPSGAPSGDACAAGLSSAMICWACCQRHGGINKAARIHPIAGCCDMLQVRAHSAASGNRGVVYKGPGHVAVEPIPFPKLELVRVWRKRAGSQCGRPRVNSTHAAASASTASFSSWWQRIFAARISTWCAGGPRPLQAWSWATRCGASSAVTPK